MFLSCFNFLPSKLSHSKSSSLEQNIRHHCTANTSMRSLASLLERTCPKEWPVEHTSPHSWVQHGVSSRHSLSSPLLWAHPSLGPQMPSWGGGCRGQRQAGVHNALCCLLVFHHRSTPEGSSFSPIKHTLYLQVRLPFLGPLGIRGVF